MYNILPFMEQAAKHDMPKDGLPEKLTDPQLEGARRMLIDPVGILYCPSRRTGKFFNKEKQIRFANNSAMNPPEERDYIGRGDYAGNAGDYAIGGGATGPAGFTSIYKWLTVDSQGLLNPDINPDGTLYFTGISFERSEIGLKHIGDGTSRTYLYGEKYLDPTAYETGRDTGDNENWSAGHDNDTLRTTAFPPLQDTAGLENGNIFGSAHTATWNVAWCDGHVESLSYDIDPQVHKNNGNRWDGNTTRP
jgi:hypothetical protein